MVTLQQQVPACPIPEAVAPLSYEDWVSLPAPPTITFSVPRPGSPRPLTCILTADREEYARLQDAIRQGVRRETVVLSPLEWRALWDALAVGREEGRPNPAARLCQWTLAAKAELGPGARIVAGGSRADVQAALLALEQPAARRQ